MSLILWPVAVVAFLVWSFAAWVLYSLSDWAAGLVASLMGGVLSAELGPWAQWVSSSLGDILQVLIVVTWAVLGIAILTAPAWVGRLMRRREGTPYAYAAGGRGEEWPESRRWRGGEGSDRDSRRDGDEWRGRGDWHGRKDWEDREDWDHKDRKDRRRYRGEEFDFLRHLAQDMGKKYGFKKWKKKWDD